MLQASPRPSRTFSFWSSGKGIPILLVAQGADERVVEALRRRVADGGGVGRALLRSARLLRRCNEVRGGVMATSQVARQRQAPSASRVLLYSSRSPIASANAPSNRPAVSHSPTGRRRRRPRGRPRSRGASPGT